MTPRSLQARRKQLNRLEREERLGALQIELANNKTKRLSQLRAFARVVRGCCLILLQTSYCWALALISGSYSAALTTPAQLSCPHQRL